MIIVETTNEYVTEPVTKFKLLATRMVEVGWDGDGTIPVAPYSTSRANIKKLMQSKPRTLLDLQYKIGFRPPSYPFAEAFHSGQMCKIGCCVFRGSEYRKLRKWALA